MSAWALRSSKRSAANWLRLNGPTLALTARQHEALQFERQRDADAFLHFIGLKKYDDWGEVWKKILSVEEL